MRVVRLPKKKVSFLRFHSVCSLSLQQRQLSHFILVFFSVLSQCVYNICVLKCLFDPGVFLQGLLLLEEGEKGLLPLDCWLAPGQIFLPSSPTQNFSFKFHSSAGQERQPKFFLHMVLLLEREENRRSPYPCPSPRPHQQPERILTAPFYLCSLKKPPQGEQTRVLGVIHEEEEFLLYNFSLYS